MPTYDYACPGCGGFDALRTVACRDEPVACPDCGTASPRVLVTAPRLALMASGTRHAITTNERAAHAPRSSRDEPARHPSGCSCCSSGRRGATVTGTHGAKAFPSRRPWMISH